MGRTNDALVYFGFKEQATAPDTSVVATRAECSRLAWLMLAVAFASAITGTAVAGWSAGEVAVLSPFGALGFGAVALWQAWWKVPAGAAAPLDTDHPTTARAHFPALHATALGLGGGAAHGALAGVLGLGPTFAPGWWLGAAGANAIMWWRVRKWESVRGERLYTISSRHPNRDRPSHFRGPLPPI